MPPPLVRINLDPAEEIARLHGVGLILARRIVEYRERSGYFRTPDDLDQVEGISFNLAQALSPHLDWTVPAQPPPRPVLRWWKVLLIWALVVFFALWAKPLGILAKVGNDLRVLTATDLALPPLISLALHVSQALLVLLVVLMAVYLTTARPTWRGRVGTALFVVTAVALSLMIGALAAAALSLYRSDSAGRLMNPKVLIGAAQILTTAVLFLPAVIGYLWGNAFSNRRFSRAFEYLIASTYFGLLALYAAFYREFEVSTFERAVTLLHSLFILALTAHSLRSGRTWVDAISGILQVNKNREAATTKEAWMRWLNNRLPDPEAQKALKEALNDAYRPSKLRTFTSLVILTVGGWLLLTTAGAIVEWGVQKLLDRFAAP